MGIKRLLTFAVGNGKSMANCGTDKSRWKWCYRWQHSTSDDDQFANNIVINICIILVHPNSAKLWSMKTQFQKHVLSTSNFVMTMVGFSYR